MQELRSSSEEARSSKLEARSSKLEARSSKLEARSSKLEARSSKLEARLRVELACRIFEHLSLISVLWHLWVKLSSENMELWNRWFRCFVQRFPSMDTGHANAGLCMLWNVVNFVVGIHEKQNEIPNPITCRFRPCGVCYICR